MSRIVLETDASIVRTVLMSSQFEKAPIIVIFCESKCLMYVNFNDVEVVKLYPII